MAISIILGQHMQCSVSHSALPLIHLHRARHLTRTNTALQHRPAPAGGSRLLAVRTCAYATSSSSSQVEVRRVVQAFHSAGVAEEHVSRAYKLCPGLLSYPLDRVTTALAFLADDLQLGPEAIGKVLVRHPEVFGYSLEHRLLPAAAFLREDLGLTPEAVQDVVTRWPVIFSYNTRAQLKPQLAYLQSLGVAADALPGLVCSRPLVLGEGIETVVRFLKRAGLPRTQVYRMLATYPLDYQIAFERYVGAGSAGGGSTPTPGQRLDGPFPPTPVDDSTH